MNSEQSSLARRNFIKDSGLMIAGGAIGGAAAAASAVRGDSAEPIRVALIGCGRRARELALEMAQVPGQPVSIVAFADVFDSQTQSIYRAVKGRHPEIIDDSCLRLGSPGAAERVMESEADVVFLTTPPAQRPELFRAAVENGKHVFMEKPIACTVAGTLKCKRVSAEAAEKGLTVYAGFQRRFDHCYRETVKRIHDGAIGNVLFARSFCNAGPLRKATRGRNESDEAFRIKNWSHFESMGGDFLVEQHVAGLDAVRWAIDQSPVVAHGQGGWVEASDRGEVFDHHLLQFEFDRGAVLVSQCRRIAKGWNHTGETIHGTSGVADLATGKIHDHKGSLIWEAERPYSSKAATAAQQAEFFRSIRFGLAQNQVDEAAQSNFLALLGQQASKTAKRARFDRLAISAATFD